MSTSTKSRTRSRRATRTMSPSRSRIRPHVPVSRTDTPGVCATCNLSIITSGARYANDRHLTMDEFLTMLLDTATVVDIRSVAAGDTG